jgi:hypothetical protein
MQAALGSSLNFGGTSAGLVMVLYTLGGRAAEARGRTNVLVRRQYGSRARCRREESLKVVVVILIVVAAAAAAAELRRLPSLLFLILLW